MAKQRGSKPEEPGVEQSAPATPAADAAGQAPAAPEGSKPEEPGVAAAPAPSRPRRPGLVDLEALKTCAAHGMPQFAGARFLATVDVAERLVAKGVAKRV